MKRTAIVFGALVAGALIGPVGAQQITPELRPFVGAYLPTGAQRDLFKDATLLGVQGALELEPTFHLLGTFSWVPAHNKYAGFDENVSIFVYDVGAEVGMVQPLAAGLELKPFVGLGAGARTYVYRAAALSDRTCAAGYGALGSEFQFDRIAFRLEARGNVFCYRSPISGVGSKTRNDVGLAFGFAYHFR